MIKEPYILDDIQKLKDKMIVSGPIKVDENHTYIAASITCSAGITLPNGPFDEGMREKAKDFLLESMVHLLAKQPTTVAVLKDRIPLNPNEP